MIRFAIVSLAVCCAPLCVAGETDAVALMKNAHDGRATWDEFPGFSAKLIVSEDDRQATGNITVSTTGKVSVQMSESFSWVNRKLRSLVGHRMAGGERQFDVAFADTKETPLGRLIKINDDALMGSKYRVQGDVIREVHRNMEDSRFTITVIDVARNKEGRHLPSVYAVSYWDKKSGVLKSTSVVRDTWTRIGSWDLPASQLAVESTNEGTRVVKEIRLVDHRLLNASAE